MEITNEVFEAANRRGQAMKARFPAVVAVRYDHYLARAVVSPSSGLVDLAFFPQDAQGLENATPDDLAGAEISPEMSSCPFLNVRMSSKPLMVA
jgi:hypothetical protein